MCHEEFVIKDRVAAFDAPSSVSAFEVPDAEVATRLAALLELTDARGFALLCGRWAIHAGMISQMTDAPLVLVNHSIAAPAHAAAGAVRARVVPFAESSARAIALDEMSSSGIVVSGVRAVKPGGRVLGPITMAVPAGVTELVRDDRVWVGEKSTASPSTTRPIAITRAPR